MTICSVSNRNVLGRNGGGAQACVKAVKSFVWLGGGSRWKARAYEEQVENAGSLNLCWSPAVKDGVFDDELSGGLEAKAKFVRGFLRCGGKYDVRMAAVM